MLRVILWMIILSIPGTIFCQVERNRYQTQKSAIRIDAMKDGQHYTWENQHINLVLDYKVGNFQATLKNKDFVNTGTTEQPVSSDREEELEYILRGILPIFDILNQKAIKQQYAVELSLYNRELGLDNPVQFTLTVTNPGTSRSNYRLFSLKGKIYNSEMQLPAFEGFDDEIEILLGWTAYEIIH